MTAAKHKTWVVWRRFKANKETRKKTRKKWDPWKKALAFTTYDHYFTAKEMANDWIEARKKHMRPDAQYTALPEGREPK